MDIIKATFRSVFINNEPLFALIGDRVYPKHITDVKNQAFPCVTIGFEKIMSAKNEIEDSGYYFIDVWSKTGNDELTAIYSIIKSLINKKRNLGGGIVHCIQYHANDDLYEEDTKTYHLCARYKVTTLDVACN
jgi:hypothetical protein